MGSEMKRRNFVLGATALAWLSACANKFPVYRGPKVTLVSVNKSNRKMHLYSGKRLLKVYDFELGFAPTGHKTIEGDGKTPEGEYFIDRKNPNSSFYLSVGISYPNANDIARARAMGKSPGGDIFIHGTPKKFSNKQDWTWGCIAVTDREMREIYSMLTIGTKIVIQP